MENGIETNLKDECNINNHQDLNDKCNNEDEKDISEPQGIKISEQMGCNYENDLQNGLVHNTDKVGANRTEFYFETDHDALRGNPDYLTVLKTLAILEAQKVQAVKDLEILQDARTKAVNDPLTLVAKLQNGENLKLPGKQKIAQLPFINWDKYGLASLSEQATFSIRKPETRGNVSSMINQVGTFQALNLQTMLNLSNIMPGMVFVILLLYNICRNKQRHPKLESFRKCKYLRNSIHFTWINSTRS